MQVLGDEKSHLISGSRKFQFGKFFKSHFWSEMTSPSHNHQRSSRAIRYPSFRVYPTSLSHTYKYDEWQHAITASFISQCECEWEWQRTARFLLIKRNWLLISIIPVSRADTAKNPSYAHSFFPYSPVSVRWVFCCDFSWEIVGIWDAVEHTFWQAEFHQKRRCYISLKNTIF